MWYNVSTTKHWTHNNKKGIVMLNINTLGNGLKRGILNFCKKISNGLYKPEQHFIADMIYGILASKSSRLTQIGRELKEGISLKKTVDRLGRNLSNFSEMDVITGNYLKTIRPYLADDTMLLIDGSDVTKPCSPKMEAIGSVLDGSTGKFADGYWTLGVAALTRQNNQPIPVYEKLYPCKKQGGKGLKAETSAALLYLRENFDKNCPRVFDRGFDCGKLMQELVANEEHFIVRQNQNRVAVHHGKRTKIEDVARGLDCTHTLSFRSKTGGTSACKIGMTAVFLPNAGNLKLNLVVCKSFGENSLVLYTNIDDPLETIALRIVKAYLMRWRIEEMYALKKQALNFEDFRVRSLSAIQTLDLLITIAVGYIAMLSDKATDSAFVVSIIAVSKRVQKLSKFLKNTKFLSYAVIDGVSKILGCLQCGIAHFFASKHVPMQICLPGFGEMG